MICRGALVCRLAQYRLVRLPVRMVPFPMTLNVVVILLECRARFNFRRLRRVRLNAGPVLRWTTTSGARGSFVDASRVRPIPRKIQAVPPLPQTGRTLVQRTLVRRTVVARPIVNGRTLFRRLTTCRDQLRRRRVQLLVLSRGLMNGPGVLCDLQWTKARNVYEVSKESRTVQGVSPVGDGLKTDRSHRSNPAPKHRAPIHLNA